MTFPKLPSPKKLWSKHEQLVLEVFTLSLQMLRKEAKLPVDEDSISEVLALITRDVNLSLNSKGRGIQFPPVWEKPIPPLYRSDIGQSKKKKRPDFSCPFRNHAAKSQENAYLDYHIECKRLGQPTSRTWILNHNYVVRGILRFTDPAYGYGNGTKSGAMIGYIQNMNMNSITAKINAYITTIPNSRLSSLDFPKDDFDSGGIANTSQSLKRKSICPSTFDLRHLWIDLRRAI